MVFLLTALETVLIFLDFYIFVSLNKPVRAPAAGPGVKMLGGGEAGGFWGCQVSMGEEAWPLVRRLSHPGPRRGLAGFPSRGCFCLC